MTDLPTATRPVAIVTGAARGIGAAVAVQLARDGMAVGVVDLDETACADTVRAVRDEGADALAVAADVDDETAVAAAVDRVVTGLGPPAVLVHNAGVNRPDTGVAEMTTEQWDTVTGVSLRGAFFLVRAVTPYLTAAGGGRIVVMSSVSALGDAGRPDYAAAKAGLIGFTRSLAQQLGPQGVTVNAVAPGFVVSEMTRTSARRRGRTFDEHQRIAAESVPVRRVGVPEDVAHAVSFFAGPRSGYVSGQVLFVAGGPVG